MENELQNAHQAQILIAFTSEYIERLVLKYGVQTAERRWSQ